jgi:hypothetical protein
MFSSWRAARLFSNAESASAITESHPNVDRTSLPRLCNPHHLNYFATCERHKHWNADPILKHVRRRTRNCQMWPLRIIKRWRGPRRSSPACQRQVPFSSAVHGPDVALEIASCADTLHAKHASNARLHHIGCYRLPSDGDYRDVIVLAELLRCPGDLGGRSGCEFSCALEPE